MKYWPLIGLALLVGCDKKKHTLPLQPSVASIVPSQATLSVYAIAGQSNSLYMAQQQLEYIRQSLGAVAVVSCGVGSTQMSRWTQGGDLYSGCKDLINETLAANPGSTLKGIMFWQGESDCNAIDAPLWVGRFRHMVDGYRLTWPNLLIVFAQITDTHTEQRDEMRAYQAGVYIPNVTMIGTDGITYVGDHTDEAGYRIMADRFIQAIARAVT